MITLSESSVSIGRGLPLESGEKNAHPTDQRSTGLPCGLRRSTSGAAGREIHSESFIQL